MEKETDIELFDLNDAKVGTVKMPTRKLEDPPRIIVYQGRKFLEGGGDDSFYGFGQAVEIPRPN